MNAHSTLKPHYPSKAKLQAYVEQARQLGLDVAAFEVSPDGTIRILSSAAFPSKPKDEFEAWDQAGKL
ncbi:hypothetical protein [Novosphingobium kaempferiae]|uniref:hypothetical protein n=1 Tax=Novosphingobium kaempferiae TaxID=2896849 RepID=UPI001E47E13F|nr:hypothetical protein [Novosphingobium kaempferiae]